MSPKDVPIDSLIGEYVHVSYSCDGFTIGCGGILQKHELGWIINDGKYGVAIFSNESIESCQFIFRGAYNQITLKSL